ncbi:MAG TPA: pantoate--beta-alanine ligase, partial [Candidatus Spyradenecus faecavium]|nr:pantoate--beta-alanine ligase [Candidatus Spyradenecus faecavium]
RVIGLVPTMGCLHQGHLSLIRLAKERCDRVVVSVFVNPTQFAPNEDYDAYPRREQDDLALCQAEGADAVFLPRPADLYAQDHSAWVEETLLAKTLEGAQRPTHFRGVCTVVAKLFNIVQPDLAVFGQKDFQQVAVIRRMVRDLNFPIEILRAPIVRDADGLALSSRNAYLTPENRASALCLSRAVRQAQDAVAAGQRDAAAIQADADRTLRDAGWIPDYAIVVDAETLMPIPTVLPGASALLLAARKDGLRLIDNTLL